MLNFIKGEGLPGKGGILSKVGRGAGLRGRGAVGTGRRNRREVDFYPVRVWRAGGEQGGLKVCVQCEL